MIEISEMESRGVYHRDVSLGNMFTRRRPVTANKQEDDQNQSAIPRGWLDDFDCSYAEGHEEDDVDGRDALSVCLLQ